MQFSNILRFNVLVLALGGSLAFGKPTKPVQAPLLKGTYTTFVVCGKDKNIFFQLGLDKDAGLYVAAIQNGEGFQTSSALMSVLEKPEAITTIEKVSFKRDAKTGLLEIGVPMHILGIIKYVEIKTGVWEARTPAFYVSAEKVEPIDCQIRDVNL